VVMRSAGGIISRRRAAILCPVCTQSFKLEDGITRHSRCVGYADAVTASHV